MYSVNVTRQPHAAHPPPTTTKGSIDDETIRKLADAMVDTGLKDAGFTYLNLDDGWASVNRAADGSVVPNPALFPSGMKSLGDYVHSKGLLFGIYTAENPKTCMGKAGSYNHELQDAASYCAWGVDYVKVDHCGDGLHAWPRMNQSWALFRQGFDKCAASRTVRQRMVLSVEYCTVDVPKCASWFAGKEGTPNSLAGCSAWLTEAKVDLWRVKSDISPHWAAIVAGADCAAISRPLSVNMSAATRGFNDPDILEVGHPALSFAEQRSHFSLWVILAAPLLISTDLTTLSNETLSLLTNKEVIAINQDPLGVQGLEVPCTAHPATADGGAAVGEETPAAAADAAAGTSDAICSAATFPINFNGTQCMHLSQAPASSYAECMAACCTLGRTCNTFQWCPPGHHGGAKDCAPASSCFVGSSTNECHAQPGWQGGARKGQSPPSPPPSPPPPSPPPPSPPPPSPSPSSTRAYLKPLTPIPSRTALRSATVQHWGLVMLNDCAQSQRLQVKWADIGLPTSAFNTLRVRDLWSHTELGNHSGSFEATVESHGVVFVELFAEG